LTLEKLGGVVLLALFIGNLSIPVLLTENANHSSIIVGNTDIIHNFHTNHSGTIHYLYRLQFLHNF